MTLTLQRQTKKILCRVLAEPQQPTLAIQTLSHRPEWASSASNKVLLN